MIKRKTILLILVCLSLANNAYSQRKIITGNEFSSATEKAIEKSHVFPRRHIFTEETYADGQLLKTNNSIWEAVSYDEQRSIRTEKVADKITKLEIITIGLDVYKRENDGEWKKEERKYEHGLNKQLVEILGCSEFWVEAVNINKQNAQVFESFQISVDKQGLAYEQDKNWISNNGLLLKRETTYGLLNPRNIIRHEILSYEYDLTNFKIEAPIK